MLKVNEIYYSVQGESTHTGLPCIFVRLTYCNLRCTYCDTEYAFYDGEDLSINQLIEKVKHYSCNLGEVTGGEPLMQEESYLLLKKLCDEDFEVLLETGGSLPIKEVDKKVKGIIVEQLGVSENEVVPTASFLDDLGADSLDTVEMVMALEEEFNIEIPDDDAEKIQTVGHAVDYLKSHPSKE